MKGAPIHNVANYTKENYLFTHHRLLRLSQRLKTDLSH